MSQSSFDVATIGEKKSGWGFWHSGAAVFGLLEVLLEP